MVDEVYGVVCRLSQVVIEFCDFPTGEFRSRNKQRRWGRSASVVGKAREEEYDEGEIGGLDVGGGRRSDRALVSLVRNILTQPESRDR